MARFQSIGNEDTVFPNECEKRRWPADNGPGLHLILETLMLRRRFRELGYSSVFGLQSIFRLPSVWSRLARAD